MWVEWSVLTLPVFGNGCSGSWGLSQRTDVIGVAEDPSERGAWLNTSKEEQMGTYSPPVAVGCRSKTIYLSSVGYFLWQGSSWGKAWNDQRVRLSLGIQYKVKYNLYYCISSGIDFSVTLDCLYAMLLLKLKCEIFIMKSYAVWKDVFTLGDMQKI